MYSYFIHKNIFYSHLEALLVDLRNGTTGHHILWAVWHWWPCDGGLCLGFLRQLCLIERVLKGKPRQSALTHPHHWHSVAIWSWQRNVDQWLTMVWSQGLMLPAVSQTQVLILSVDVLTLLPKHVMSVWTHQVHMIAVQVVFIGNIQHARSGPVRHWKLRGQLFHF